MITLASCPTSRKPRPRFWEPGTLGEQLLTVDLAACDSDRDRRAALDRATALILPHFRDERLRRRGVSR